MTTPSIAERTRAAGHAARGTVTFLVADGIDDPARVSGGNVYDWHLRDRLGARGWRVSTVPVADAAGVGAALASLPDEATVLVDGLVAVWAPDHMAAEGERVRLVVLAHMVAAAFPGATDAQVGAERRSLAAARHVVVTSAWTARELERRGLVDAARLSVATPGTAASGRTARAGGGRRLLCVGVVAPHKGQDVLLAALARLPEREWACAIVGSAQAAPAFAASIARGAEAFDGRVRLTGVLGRTALEAEYARGGLLVAPSRVESAGMAIAEARARGIPVVAAAVGGIPDTVAGGGAILVRPDDPAALAAALQAWMTDPALRRRLRREARAARTGLPTWDDTAATVAAVLAGVCDLPSERSEST